MWNASLIFGRYFLLGSGLTLVGATIVIFSFLMIHVIALVAFGMACAVIGLTAISLPEEVSGSKAMRALLRGAAIGIDPLLQEIESRRKLNERLLINPSTEDSTEVLEEGRGGSHSEQDTLGIERENDLQKVKRRAIYLPPLTGANGNKGDTEYNTIISTYIPICGDPILPEYEEMIQAPLTLLANREPHQKGIRIFTPGACLVDLIEVLGQDIELEDALQSVLVESAEFCSSVRASRLRDSIVVQLNHVKVDVESKTYHKLLGSLPTSVAACVIVAVERKPVVVLDEEITPTKTVTRFEILNVQKGEGR